MCIRLLAWDPTPSTLRAPALSTAKDQPNHRDWQLAAGISAGWCRSNCLISLDHEDLAEAWRRIALCMNDFAVGRPPLTGLAISGYQERKFATPSGLPRILPQYPVRPADWILLGLGARGPARKVSPYLNPTILGG